MAKIQSRRINSPLLIGAFVIIGSLLILGAIIWLGAGEFLKERTFYTTYFNSSVEGLDPGSAVKYQGVPVGTISKIRVAPNGKYVEIVMQISKRIAINDSLRVKAEMAGIAGGKFLQLHYPKNKKIAMMFPEVDFETPFPMIKSAPSGLEEIEIAMREVMNNLKMLEVTEISDGTIQFLHSADNFFNNDELFKLISNLEKTSKNLASITAKADTSNILANLSHTSKKLYQTSIELKSFADKLNTQIDDLELDQYVDRAFNKFDTTLSNTNTIINTLGYRSESAVYSLNEMMLEFKKTNLELQRVLHSLSDHPSQIFLVNPPEKDE